MKNKFGFMDNGTLLTIVDGQHQALFSIQNPASMNVIYHLSGDNILMSSSGTDFVLYKAESLDEAQLILDTLLRGLVKMTIFKRLAIDLFIWLIAIILFLTFGQNISTIQSITGAIMFFVPAFSILMFSLSHFEKAMRLKSVFANHPSSPDGTTPEPKG